MDFAAGVYLSEAQNPPLHTEYVYTAYLFTMYLQSLLTLKKRPPQSPFTGQLFEWLFLLWCLFS